jgi:hypothetical protein
MAASASITDGWLLGPDASTLSKSQLGAYREAVLQPRPAGASLWVPVSLRSNAATAGTLGNRMQNLANTTAEMMHPPVDDPDGMLVSWAFAVVVHAAIINHLGHRITNVPANTPTEDQ